MLSPRRLWPIALIACLPLAAQANIYRWVDANGVVNYTQQKPRGVDAELVGTRRGTPPPATQATDTEAAEAEEATPGSVARDASMEERRAAMSEAQRQRLAELEAAEEERRAKLAMERAENCEKANDILDQLTERTRIRIRDEDGTERIIGEDERQSRIQDAQMAIAEHCTETS